MKTVQHQPDRESYRLIALRRNRTELLLLAKEAGFQLPSVEIPRWQRMAENLTSALKENWGCDAICVFELQERLKSAACDERRYQVMECLRWSEASIDGASWLPVRSLSCESFHDTTDYAALRRFFTECNLHKGDSCSPFLQPGWFQELEKWTSEVIRSVDIQLTGPFRQLSATRSFSLIRFESNGPAVWFKAVGEPNQQEFGITIKLAELFPEFIPNVIGARPDWNGWLALEVKGADLSEIREIAGWENAAATLARLQIESLGKVNDIVSAGARDLSTVALSAMASPFFEVITELMMRQPKVPPPILCRQDLRRLEEQIQDGLALVEELGIPYALGHLDLNPGNVTVSPESCVFLDWAEAYAGNPFFTFEYLLEHFRRTFARNPENERRIVSAYVQQWNQVLSSAVTEDALRLSPLLAVFAYAAGTNSWRDMERLKDRATAGYLRSLARLMNREANDPSNRRPLCLC